MVFDSKEFLGEEPYLKMVMKKRSVNKQNTVHGPYHLHHHYLGSNQVLNKRQKTLPKKLSVISSHLNDIKRFINKE